MPTPTVFVVDDDAAVRRAVERLLTMAHHQVVTFAAADDFLAAFDPERPGCLILDVRMPGMDGIALQKHLAANGAAIPIIILTAHGDVPMAVEALHDGAVDFVEKPFDKQRLLACVKRAIDQDAEARRERTELHDVRTKWETLSAREREVAELLTAGRPVKEIASGFGTNRHTVKHQRASVLKKMQVASDVELAERIAILRSAEPPQSK